MITIFQNRQTLFLRILLNLCIVYGLPKNYGVTLRNSIVVRKVTLRTTVLESTYPDDALFWSETRVGGGSEDSFQFYKREDWGAQPSTDNRTLTLPVPYVVIHHTYIPGACYTTDECAAAMRSMQNYHNSMGWGDIGYNFCVGSEGGVYEGRGWAHVGIHAGRANRVSVGICLIGDWREVTPPANTLAASRALIAAGVARGVISPDYKLVGHNQVMATECPGTALSDQISTWDHFTKQIDL